MKWVETQPVQEEGIVVWVYLYWPVDVVFKICLMFLRLLFGHTLSVEKVVEVVPEAVRVVAELTFRPPASFTSVVIVLWVLFESITERTRVSTLVSWLA